MHKHLITVGSLLGLLLVPAIVSSQQSAGGRPTRVPVTIVLVDRLPQSDAPFVIRRRPDLAPHDLILLRTDATADHLSDAVGSLLVVRQAGGDTASSPATLRMRPRSAHARGERRAFPWVPRVLADLRRAEVREVAGIGRVRAVEIWLPPQRRRGSRP